MNNENINNIWEKPVITIIDLKDTKSGDIDNSTEGSWWIFTWGS